MTEITGTDNSRRRPGVKRAVKHNLKTDMTPMVDLGFILITFFVMTVQLSQPKKIALNMPTEGPPMSLGESAVLTILLDDNDKVYYYQGKWEDALAKNDIHKTNFSVSDGIGKLIREKQQWLDINDQREGRKALMLLIKAGKEATYKKIIDALDETLINDVKKYAVVDIAIEETAWMKKQR